MVEKSKALNEEWELMSSPVFLQVNVGLTFPSHISILSIIRNHRGFYVHVIISLRNNVKPDFLYLSIIV